MVGFSVYAYLGGTIDKIIMSMFMPDTGVDILILSGGSDFLRLPRKTVRVVHAPFSCLHI